MNTSLVIFLAVVAVVVVYVVWFFARSNLLMRRWATENGYAILHSEARNLRRGPLLWTSSKHQAVYFLKVRDRDGRERLGWLCLGGFWLGLFSDEAKVKWEDEPTAKPGRV